MPCLLGPASVWRVGCVGPWERAPRGVGAGSPLVAPARCPQAGRAQQPRPRPEPLARSPPRACLCLALCRGGDEATPRTLARRNIVVDSPALRSIWASLVLCRFYVPVDCAGSWVCFGRVAWFVGCLPPWPPCIGLKPHLARARVGRTVLSARPLGEWGGEVGFAGCGGPSECGGRPNGHAPLAGPPSGPRSRWGEGLSRRCSVSTWPAPASCSGSCARFRPRPGEADGAILLRVRRTPDAFEGGDGRMPERGGVVGVGRRSRVCAGPRTCESGP